MPTRSLVRALCTIGIPAAAEEQHLLSMKLKTLSTLTLSVVAAGLSVSAAQFDFYKLGRTGQDFLPNGTAGTDYFVISSDNVSSSVPTSFGGTLNYTAGGITVSASGTYNGGTASVVQDREGNWTEARRAGLGVYHKNPLDTSDDNITAGETLTITFDRLVSISRIDLSSEGHNYTSWTSGSTFLLNGQEKALPNGVGFIGGLNLVGKTFTFAYDSTGGDQFYLAALTATAVPDGAATLTLMGLGLLALGTARRYL